MPTRIQEYPLPDRNPGVPLCRPGSMVPPQGIPEYPSSGWVLGRTLASWAQRGALVVSGAAGGGCTDSTAAIPTVPGADGRSDAIPDLLCRTPPERQLRTILTLPPPVMDHWEINVRWPAWSTSREGFKQQTNM